MRQNNVAPSKNITRARRIPGTKKMIYEAIYSGAAYDAAVKDAVWLGNGGVWGRWHVRPADGPTVALDSLAYVTEDIIRTLQEVGWTTCAGDRLLYRFDHDARTVTMLIDSRRHGIPSRFLRGYEPDKVLRYETQEPTWAWWETADMRSDAVAA